MGRNQFRAQLNVGAEDPAAYKRFDEAAARLASAGGGMISIYYHPTEFVTTEFWDGVNFAHGANPERDSVGQAAGAEQPEESERCYGVLRRFVQHMKARPGVRFVTAQDLLGLYESPAPKAVDRKAAAAHLSRHIVFGDMQGQTLSPAEMLMALLEVQPQTVDGPVGAGQDHLRQRPPFRPRRSARRQPMRPISSAAFHRLPNEVFIGAETLSLADFAAIAGGQSGWSAAT